MIKKLFPLLLIAMLFISVLAGCVKKPAEVSSSVSSEFASSEIASSEIDHSGWGSADDTSGMVRPSYISSDSEGNIFYCSAAGDIYKKVANTNGLSKVYASTEYKFISVQATIKDEICAGYKKDTQTSGYIIFNLKDKTVRNAVEGAEFEDKNIYSLTYFKGAVYFLANPDRYNRYTLYMQKNGKTTEVAKGVNEFFILRDRIFYNVGSNIFSASLDASDIKFLAEVPTNDLLGFSIIGDQIIYMTSTDTHFKPMNSTTSIRIQSYLKVYTCAENESYAFFCGVDGGTYAFSKISSTFFKISEYTAGQLYADNEWLYLFPANPDEYPDIDKDNLIEGGIYRLSIEELLDYKAKTDTTAETSSSLANTESSSVSSQIAVIEIVPPKLELFGR